MKRSALAAAAGLTLALALLPPGGAVGDPVSTDAQARDYPAVVEKRIVGRTEQGRKIWAWRVGNPRSPRKAVFMASMHGDELAARRTLGNLRAGRPITGADIWLIPNYNLDGALRHRRQNARGVDLNRNYPYKWKRLYGETNSGPRPMSENETRVMMKFLNEINPKWIVSFHQPLYGIGRPDRRSEAKKFQYRLHRGLRLPFKDFDCGSSCHGTMTMWFNHKHEGTAVTVELAAHPSERYLTRVAPRGLLAAVKASR